MESAETTLDNAAILNVRVETNVPQGGDAGHGGVTRFSLKDEGSLRSASRLQIKTMIWLKSRCSAMWRHVCLPMLSFGPGNTSGN